MKENFPITDEHTGKVYWISPSVAVCAIVVITDENGQRYILINKRGEGTPNYQGCWNMPCGYLNFEETTQQACAREVCEETGVYIPSDEFKFIKVVEPDEKDKNLTFRYIAEISFDEYEKCKERGEMLKENGDFKGEINEVETVELMPLCQVSIDGKDWAFNHKEIISAMLQQ